MEQLELDEDKILSLPGIGPKAMQELREKLTAFDYPEPEVEAIVEEVVPAVEEEEVVEVTEVVEEVKEPELPEDEIEEPMEEEIEEEKPELEEAPEAPEPITTVEEVFETITEDLETLIPVREVEEEEAILPTDEEERKRKKRISRVIEYDPDTGETIVKRRRKRDEDDWEDRKY
jgi:hypothetical protein